jgi:hypothetical protein
MRGLSFVLLASLALAARAEHVDPTERFWILGISLAGELGVRYEREAERLQDLCQTWPRYPQDEEPRRLCMEKYLDRTTDRIVTVRDAPDANGAVVGVVYGVMRADAWNIQYELEFAPAEDLSRRRVWIASPGEWLHGVDQPGVRVRGDWVQLIGPPFPPSSWIDRRESKLPLDVSGLEIVTLPALTAAFPDGTQHAIAPGNYRVERIADGVVTFRAEIPSDMPCNGPDEPPPAPPSPMPETLRAPAANFFGADGAALFRDAWPGGCC